MSVAEFLDGRTYIAFKDNEAYLVEWLGMFSLRIGMVPMSTMEIYDTEVTVLAVELRIGNPAQRTDSARRAMNS